MLTDDRGQWRMRVPLMRRWLIERGHSPHAGFGRRSCASSSSRKPAAGAFGGAVVEDVEVVSRPTNRTRMWHPMHLHGHFFRLLDTGAAPELAPLKHTVSLPPDGKVRVEFLADNPGRWFFHCHNRYHMETGIARVALYRVTA
jgi:Multicopper oxidase